MKSHLRRVHCLHILTLTGRVLISLTNHIGGSISRPLKASTSFVLSGAEVMNEINHLVLLLLLFPSKGAARYWGNPRDKIFHPHSRCLWPFGHPPTLLRCLEGKTRTLFRKKETLETATPIILLRCLGDKAKILPSQRRLPRLGTDHQLSTNRLDLGSLSWRRAFRG